MKANVQTADLRTPQKGRWRKVLHEQKYLLLMLILPLAYYIIFHYGPMYGVIIAFKKFEFAKGIWASPWVGFKYFEQFITGDHFWRLIRNTFLLSFYNLLFYFPIPIVFALFLNEVRSAKFKKVVQTVSYLPHFVSVVIVVGLLQSLLSPSSGVVNEIITKITGGEPINFFMEPKWFRTMYIGSSIWQEFGWGSIIYLASLSQVDTQLYESAHLDGAGRFRCMWHITLPAIKPTIVTLLILRVGNMMSVGFEKVILMYNEGTYETADIISSYVYRTGLGSANPNYSFGAAVGLFQSVIGMILIIITNTISNKLTETSLW